MATPYPIVTKGNNYWLNKERFLLVSDVYSCWSIMFVEKGSFRYSIDLVSGIASRGDCVICPPNMAFQREVIQPVNLHFLLFAWSDNERNAEGAALAKSFGYKIKTADISRLQSSLKRLHRHTLKYSIRNHYMNDIVIQLYDDMRNPGEEALPPSKEMMLAKSRIEERAFQNVQLKDIAGEFHLSKVEFERRFAASYHVTPKEHLTSIRMDKARSLLSETNLTIDHIAQLCGYDNGFYFSRIFSKINLMTPSEYRKTYGI